MRITPQDYRLVGGAVRRQTRGTAGMKVVDTLERRSACWGSCDAGRQPILALLRPTSLAGGFRANMSLRIVESRFTQPYPRAAFLRWTLSPALAPLRAMGAEHIPQPLESDILEALVDLGRVAASGLG